MKNKHSKKLSSKFIQGQITFGAIAIGLPIFFLSLIVVIDFGRVLILHNQAKIYADGAALAAAGAVDIDQFTSSRTTTLDQGWAQTRAYDHFNWAIENYENQDGWMRMRLVNVSIMGNMAYATVEGRCDSVMSKVFGIDEWRTMVTSSARASAGISSDIAP